MTAVRSARDVNNIALRPSGGQTGRADFLTSDNDQDRCRITCSLMFKDEIGRWARAECEKQITLRRPRKSRRWLVMRWKEGYYTGSPFKGWSKKEEKV